MEVSNNKMRFSPTICVTHTCNGKNANGSEIKLSIKEKKQEGLRKTTFKEMLDCDSDETDNEVNDDSNSDITEVSTEEGGENT